MKNNIKLTEIIEDNNKLDDYLYQLQNELNNSDKTEKQLDEILNNILVLLDNFKDRRSLKATLISSINEMFQLKQQITNDKIKNSKTIFDIAKTKKELEIKEHQATATEALATGVGSSLNAIFGILDTEKIHPTKLTDEEIKTECYSIIDIPEEEKLKDEVKQLSEAEEEPTIKADDIRDILDNTVKAG